MRCRQCDVKLSDYECTFKVPGSDEYADLCMECYSNGVNDVKELINDDEFNLEDFTDDSM